MKIFGLMAVKNEVDIVAHTLQAAAQWCDAIYVLDNGSDDGTWEVVTRLARCNSAIVAHGQTFDVFDDSIRARLFNAYRKHALDGDWWCRLDADEIYVQSPRTFLADVSSREVVWAIHLQYYFTDADLAQFNNNPELYDPSIPPTERYRYYRAEASEARFFRHRPRLHWDSGTWPRHLGRVYPKRILVRHYQFRNPSQIKARLATRLAVFDRGGKGFDHWRNTDWRLPIVNSSTLNYDSGDGTFFIDQKVLPRHRDPAWRVAYKAVMHGTRLWP